MEEKQPTREILERPTVIEPGGKQNLMVTIAISVMLALPIVYLALKHVPSATTDVMAGQAAPDLATLEKTAGATPTISNELNLAAAYINASRPGSATALLDKVLIAEPHNPIAWNNYCVLHMMQQDYISAIDACNEAIAASPDFKLAQNNLAWANSEKQKAQNLLAADEQLAPKDRTESIYLRDGLNYMHLNQYDLAIHAWQGMLAINPKSFVATNNIGTAYMMEHHYDEGASWFEKAIALDPTNQLAKNNLAWASSEVANSRK